MYPNLKELVRIAYYLFKSIFINLKMGNIDSRAKFDGGYLFVKTDKPFYYPNNVVYGKIYLRAEVPL